MQLSKTTLYNRNLIGFSQRYFAAAIKEYDLAIIGGGPGGKINLLRLI